MMSKFNLRDGHGFKHDIHIKFKLYDFKFLVKLVKYQSLI